MRLHLDQNSRRWQKVQILAGVLLSVWGFSFPLPGKALGLGPSLTQAPYLFQNSAVKKELVVSRGDNLSQEAIVFLSVEGEAAPYIEVPKKARFSAGEYKIHIPFLIKPGTLGSGTYRAQIRATVGATEEPLQSSEGMSVKLLEGALVSVEFTVTTDSVEEYAIQGVNIADSEEGLAIVFSYVILNTGNVDVRPEKIKIRLVNIKDETNYFEEIVESKSLPFVKAFSEGRIDVTTRAMLKPGVYSFQVLFYNNKGGVIFTENKQHIQVHPPGTLAQKGIIETFLADKEQYEPGESVKLSGKYRNVGDIGLKTVVTLELYEKDVRLDVIKQDSVYVPTGQEGNFEYFFRPQKSGLYRAKSYLSYGPFQSNALSASFKVGKELSIAIMLSILGVIIVMVASILWWLHKKKSMTNS